METSLTIRKRKDSNKRQAIIRQKQDNKWKQVASKTFDKKMQAQQRGNRKVGEWQKKVETDYDKMTIKQLKALYLTYQKSRVKESTYKTVLSNIKNADTFDNKAVHEIKPHEVQRFIINAPYSHVVYMRVFFNYLINDLSMDTKNLFKRKRPKKSTKTFVLDEIDLEKIKSLIPNRDVKLALDFLFYTGVRISELSGLTNDSISNTEIHINKQYSVKVNKFISLKSENGERYIPIHPKLKKSIRQKGQNKVVSMDNKFFKYKHLDEKINKSFKKYLTNTEYEGVTCHDFRHSFITNLVQNNVDVITVASLAGDDINTIMKYYVHKSKKTNKITKQAINSL